MATDGIDPVLLELLSRRSAATADALERAAADIEGALAEAGVASGAPGTVRAVAAQLAADAADQRRRRQAVATDADVGDEVDRLLGWGRTLWGGNGDQTMPFGRWITTAKGTWDKVSWVLAGQAELPSILDSKGGQLVLKVAPWLDSPLTEGAVRWAGVAGGVYQGVKGTIGLVQEGNPVDAFHREGAKYVAKVAGTALGYSSAAFIACPNPVTGGAVVVSGGVWLGAEAWEHAGELANGASTAAHAVETAWDASVDAVGSAATSAAGAVSHAASSAVSTAGDVVDDVGGAISSLIP